MASVLETREDRAFGPLPVRRQRIVTPRRAIDLRPHLHGLFESDAHAVDAKLASVAAILTVLGEHRIISGRTERAISSGRARALARADVVAEALRRALLRSEASDDVAAAVVLHELLTDPPGALRS